MVQYSSSSAWKKRRVQRLLEEKEFSKPQWKRTRSARRVCAACQKREPGLWTCCVCTPRRLPTHFSRWAKTRKCGQNGRQKCNKCTNIGHAGQRTHARLQRRRCKVAEEKVAKVLQAVRAEIQQAKAKKRTRADEALKDAEKRAAAEEESGRGQQRALGTQKIERIKPIEYACPYCQASVYSSVRNGKVHVAGHCGKQFRVRNRVVARAFAHACPTCGTEVQSANASGRIQSKHKKPDGKACPRTQWQSM